MSTAKVPGRNPHRIPNKPILLRLSCSILKRFLTCRRDAANAASLLRFERVHCRGEHCSPVLVCFARKLSRKMRCCAKLAGGQWPPLHMQQAGVCRGPRGDSPGHPPQKYGAQFSVTVMVPILVLSAVALSNGPSRDREVVPLGAASTAVPTAVGRSSNVLSKAPVMPVKSASAA